MDLTPEQSQIISTVSAGANTRVIALAGCAKSTTIRLAAQALPPGRKIAILAFNKKIKDEMAKEISAPNIQIFTLNGLGHRAIQAASSKKLSLNDDKLYELCREAGTKGDDLQDLKALVQRAKREGIVPQGSHGKGLVPDTDEAWGALANELDVDSQLTSLARDVLRKSNTLALKGEIDFDDQIYISTLVFGQYPRFDTVFVDEAQDLSPFNHLQLRKCARDQIVAVGDPHQAIYAWRGADSASMDNLLALRPDFTDCTLSTTFRCPRAVVARQHAHVPLFTAGPNNVEGAIHLPDGPWLPPPTPDAAVLCRNNAPLISLAFRLLRVGIPINYLGRDIGRELKRVVKKLDPQGRRNKDELIALANNAAQSDDDRSDKYLSLIAVLESAPSLEQALEFLTTFRRNALVLSTGHRAKGLEWNQVYHMDPHLIPSRGAIAKGGAALQQERNLRYVIETRTKNELHLVNLEDLDD